MWARPYNALLLILISAGEASGEMYGAQLIEALHRRDPQRGLTSTIALESRGSGHL